MYFTCGCVVVCCIVRVVVCCIVRVVVCCVVHVVVLLLNAECLPSNTVVCW